MSRSYNAMLAACVITAAVLTYARASAQAPGVAGAQSGDCFNQDILDLLQRLDAASPPVGAGSDRFATVNQFYDTTQSRRQTCTNPSFWTPVQERLTAGAQPGSLRDAINAVNDAGNASALIKIHTANFFTTTPGLAIIGGGAAIPFIFHGGGGTAPPVGGGATPTGTTIGGGTPFQPTTLNSPPPYKADVNLLPSFTPSSEHLCAGSAAAYAESATVNLSAAGTGTITLDDTPSFQRVYQVNVTALNQAATSQGTFSFLGAPIPGSMVVTFTSTTSMTFRETTTYGSCSNTYSGTLSR